MPNRIVDLQNSFISFLEFDWKNRRIFDFVGIHLIYHQM